MDKELFYQACEKVKNNSRTPNGIGTLGEKTLHAVLKHYFEPYAGSHEVKIEKYIADIVGENGIIEIQTGGFDKLRNKLTSFLEVSSVTVVYPVASTKWLVWIDESGELTKRRKSPKKGNPCEIFFELYKIKPLLSHENLRLCVVMLDVEEYRVLDGWSKDKKKGSSRYERIPVGIVDEIHINGVSDYKRLIPENLPGEFTVRDFKKASGTSLRGAGLALNVLNDVGAVRREGKIGNAFVYKITDI
ncbi:MAG: hypothetical protein FWF05_08705 [Oscillospiraceae bacterium]|nr:hypothetical protein [Oscillospiraceae bacterium]